MMDELVDIVDEKGRAERKAYKGDAHKHGWLHKTVIGYLKYGDKWALVRQAPSKQDAGKLVAPVGGHVRSGETEEGALKREAHEEIGAKSIDFKKIGEARFHRQVIGRDENHLFCIYEISTNDRVVLNHESVSMDVFEKNELKKALKIRPEDFGDAYYFVLEHYYPEYLPAGYQRRWAKQPGAASVQHIRHGR